MHADECVEESLPHRLEETEAGDGEQEFACLGQRQPDDPLAMPRVADARGGAEVEMTSGKRQAVSGEHGLPPCEFDGNSATMGMSENEEFSIP